MISRFLIITDELSIQKTITDFFNTKNYHLAIEKSGKSGLKRFLPFHFDIILIDLDLSDIKTESIIKDIRKQDPDVIIIVMTSEGSIQSVSELFKIGINHYILKPFAIEELFYSVNNLLINKKIQEENIKLKKNLTEIYHPAGLVGESKSMKEIYEKIIQVANHDVSVLIQGESGTGKEIVARTIHFSSHRNDKPFYAINCGAIPSELLESEMFGHKKGAFTGAINDRKGIFEEASGSTLFLDEINEMPLNLQPKLLRVLQEKKIKRIGDNKEIETDFRIIAASSRNLKHELDHNSFREDLFYRLNVITINIPPLRKRKDDIPLLIDHFIKKYKKLIKKESKGISKEALEKCLEYNWPGNIRELENFVQRTIVLARGKYILPEDIMFDARDDKTEPEGENVDKVDYKKAVKNALERIDRIYIQDALKKTNYNKIKAAKLLGISPRSLHYKIKNLFPDQLSKKY
ncbi:MAG: sigma-54-dependent Fis family transcriptional regulator [Spirochaetes bacterium]|nr:sigma-54-dependent Fis family transcriptional regulator [Spirochaetota bacterium]